MMEPQISPLAKRLAEENSIDWRVIRGTGPEGRVIERDILTYLARIMSGEIDPPALPDASELPPSQGASLPDLGSISNLAAASAGMAKEGIDLGSLLTPVPAPAAPAFAPAPDLSFSAPSPAPTALETAPLSFGEPARFEAAPAAEAATASLEHISFGELPVVEDTAPIPAAEAAAPSFALETEAADFALQAPVASEPVFEPVFTASPEPEFAAPVVAAPELHESSAAVSAPPVTSDAWTFPPPKTVTESGVEFEIDLDGFDDLPDQPLETGFGTPEAAVAVPAAETSVSAGFDEDLVLEVPNDPEPVAAAPEADAGFEDHLVIDELAPVISTEPSQSPAIDPLHDLEIELDDLHTPIPEAPAFAVAEPEPDLAFELEPATSSPELSLEHNLEPSLEHNLEPSVTEPATPEFADLTPAEATPPASLSETHEPEALELNTPEPAAPASFDFAPPAEVIAAPVALAAFAASQAPTPAPAEQAAEPDRADVEPTEVAPTPAPSHSPTSPVAAGFYAGFAVRRHFDASGLSTMQEQLSKVLHGRDVPLEVFLARAAQAHLSTLGSETVTLARLGDRLEALSAPGLQHSFLEAVQSAARATPGTARGLMVLDASQLGADDLVLPGDHPVLCLNVKGEYGHLSLSGDLPAAKAAEFLGRVAESLEIPVSLVI